MKRWLTIIVLTVTAAMALAQGDEDSSSRPAALPTAVLTQHNDDIPTDDATPLLAIPTGAPMHFCGTGHTAIKGNRHTHENPELRQHLHTSTLFALIPRGNAAIRPVYRISIRSADRYIYFLRQIII